MQVVAISAFQVWLHIHCMNGCVEVNNENFHEARVAKEMDAHEKKMQEDLERQDILRRKV
ncbi:unnamed protein product [Amaranthus hypochondriacus]